MGKTGRIMTKVRRGSRYQSLPWGELMGGLHVFHDLLEGFFILYVHLVAYFALSLPIVHHDGQS